MVFADIQSAIKLAENGSINRRNKHIGIKYHFVRDVVGRKYVYLEYKPSTELVADTLKKTHESIKLEYLRGICGFSTMGKHHLN